MAEARVISSPQNAAFKQAAKYVHTKDARKDGVFLMEGVRAVDEVLKAEEWTVKSIWVGESLKKDAPGYVHHVEMKALCPMNLIPDAMLKKLSETESPQGIVAVVERRSYKIGEILKEAAAKKEKPLLVILENLQDPGNVGTLIRTADAAGATAVIATKGTADVYSSKVIRSTMGSLLHIPVCLVENVPVLAEALKKAGVQVLAAALKDSVSIYEADMTKPTALLIGNEGNGLTDEAIASATQAVKIPMVGRAESLNAAMAGGVLIYEALRQRLNG